jgi:hypothetical protein
VPVLVNEVTGLNPWEVQFRQGLFNMTGDSNLFQTDPDQELSPLYEAKMLQQYDHRFSTYEEGQIRECTTDEKKDPEFTIRPRYWVPRAEVEARLKGRWSHAWVLWFRRIARATDERTMISGFAPAHGFSDVAPLCLSTQVPRDLSCLMAMFNSLVFDYVTRQKIGSTHIDFHYLKQLPVLPPSVFLEEDRQFISLSVLELVYTAYDLKAFADDLSAGGNPFQWDDNRRAQLRAQLDAYYAHLYGLTRKEIQYVIDPKDVFGADFPSETFRVMKEKEEKEFGEYRARRLVLAAFDEHSQSGRFRGQKRECTITDETWTVGD